MSGGGVEGKNGRACTDGWGLRPSMKEDGVDGRLAAYPESRCRKPMIEDDGIFGREMLKE